MTEDGEPARDDAEDTHAEVVLDTGIRGQRLLIHGWFASHADGGTPGPHVRLGASGEMDPVLRTNQIPALIDGLNTVAERIDRQWARDGESFLRDTNFADAPDPNDPAVQRQRRIEDLELHSLVADHWTEIAPILFDAENTDDAIERIASLLNVDAVRVLVGLSRFSLFSLTRGARERREQTLAELHRESLR
ncbi:MAG: hypothetical protein M3319_08985 [Actinomycetota bacterium]|nr:hypothetical protein [Actinomycetota bacterium]